MKQLAYCLPLLCLSPADSLQYQVSEGDRLRVTSLSSAELSLNDEEVTVIMNGEEQPTGERPEMEVTLSLEQSVIFVDTIAKVGDEGQPLQIVREFETLNGVYGQEIVGLPEDVELPEPTEVGSELEGESVVFTWDADEGEWTVAAAEESDIDEDLLEPVEQNADFSYLLPTEEIEVGLSWDLDVDVFRRLADVSGDIDMQPVDSDEEEDEDDMEEVWEAETFSLEVTELTEDSATIEITAKTTRTEAGQVEVPEMPDAEMEPPTITIEDILEWELKGQLIWNRTTNRAESLEIEGTLSRSLDRKQEFEGPMGELSVHEIQSFEGPYTMSITIEDAPEGE